MCASKLLLIVLTKSASKSLNEIDVGFDEVHEALQNLDQVRLFKYPDKKKTSAWAIALPVENGRYTLLLTPDKNNQDNYFICVTVLKGCTHPTNDNNFYYELSSDVDCCLFKNSSDVDNYQDDALDHDEIHQCVSARQDWRALESSNIEERKWRTYLELHQKMIDDQKVAFLIKDIEIIQSSLRATIVDEIDKEKIQNAKGETVSVYSENKKQNIGKLSAVNNQSITLKLDDSFETNHQQSITNIISGDEQFTLQTESIQGAKKCCFVIGKTQFEANIKLAQPVKPIKLENPTKQCRYQIEQNSIKQLQLHLSIDFFGDAYQIKVMKHSLKAIKRQKIWQVLSGERVSKLPNPVNIEFGKSRLNEQQKQAVEGALGAPELFLIWGPPGTGKTEVIQEIAKHEALRGNKVLICSQSNLAVDNALARIETLPGIHPFRIAKKNYKLEGEDAQKVPTETTSGLFFIQNLHAEVQQKIQDSETGARQIALQRQFLRRLEKAEKTYHKKQKSDIERREFSQHTKLYQDTINVVGTTLMESGKRTKIRNKLCKTTKMRNKLCETTKIKMFDVVIIDEVSKATPPELFIPVSLAKRLILVGDHKQLPPMFKMLSGDDKSQEEWAKEAHIEPDKLDIETTLFQRLWERHINEASGIRAMLTQQYRMHPKIQALIEPFYTDTEGKLSFGFGEDNQEAIDNLTLGRVAFCEMRPVMWIGTRDASLECRTGTSFINEDEIEKVGKLLQMLSDSKDKQMSVGVITFYGAQLKQLRNCYDSEYRDKFGEGKLIFGTVDRFQGRECDVIICSLVRNNKGRNIGFASKINRINVAFSRAKKSLIILGSKAQFCFEAKNKDAKQTYKAIYDKCDKPKPKELK